MPAVRERIIALGGDPAPMTPTQFAQRMQEDSLRFGKIIQARGIKAE
jgi:hypothetical protein